jgi:5-methylcytosine-specific restriction enzyme A
MTTNRVSTNAGWVRAKSLPRGPSGRALCRWCQTEVEPPRRTFCSEECVHEHRIRSDPGYLRAKVYERDKGKCSNCGFEAAEAEERIRSLHRTLLKTAYNSQKYTQLTQALRDLVNPLEQKGFDVTLRYGSLRLTTLWNADHTVPVIEGGGECSLDGLRTLCIACHKKETADLRKRLATKTRKKKSQTKRKKK